MQLLLEESSRPKVRNEGSMDPDREMSGAQRFLQAVAMGNEQLAEFARNLRSQAIVRRVTRGIDIRAYESGTVLEIYIDAEFETGEGVTWWLDARPVDDGWVVESRVQINRGEYQETIVDFPSRTARTLNEFITGLQDATNELLGAQDIIRFNRP